MADRQTRKSGIELLKIFAVFLIVISHVVQTLGALDGVYQLRLSLATTDMSRLMLAALRYSGVLGNSIFFVCSAWFLVDAKKWNLRKLLYLWSQVWSVSALILLIVLVLGDVPLRKGILFESLLPVIFNNNWYISCYMMFCLIVPLLNIVLGVLTRRQLLSVCVMGTILCGIRFAFMGYAAPFYINGIILWSIIYFCVAYIKRYKPMWFSNYKYGGICFTAGVIGFVGMIILANSLGQKISVFSSALLRWNENGNLFIILTAIGLLLLAHNTRIQSRFINTISGLSLLVYIIHENLLLRTFYRPKLFDWLYHTYGSVNLVAWSLIFAAAIFIGSVIVSYCYQQTVCRLLAKVCDWLYPKLELGWNRLLDRLEK